MVNWESYPIKQGSKFYLMNKSSLNSHFVTLLVIELPILVVFSSKKVLDSEQYLQKMDASNLASPYPNATEIEQLHRGNYALQ